MSSPMTCGQGRRGRLGGRIGGGSPRRPIERKIVCLACHEAIEGPAYRIPSPVLTVQMGQAQPYRPPPGRCSVWCDMLDVERMVQESCWHADFVMDATLRRLESYLWAQNGKRVREYRERQDVSMG